MYVSEMELYLLNIILLPPCVRSSSIFRINFTSDWSPMYSVAFLFTTFLNPVATAPPMPYPKPDDFLSVESPALHVNALHNFVLSKSRRMVRNCFHHATQNSGYRIWQLVGYIRRYRTIYGECKVIHDIRPNIIAACRVGPCHCWEKTTSATTTSKRHRWKHQSPAADLQTLRNNALEKMYRFMRQS